MLSIDPSRTDLCEEYKRQPFGRHSADLHKLLDLMRWGFARGRTVILCTVPHKEWRLAQYGPRRGTPMQVDESRAFHRYEEAAWACFRARWREMTGSECPVE
jgi:hypothetical protein